MAADSDVCYVIGSGPAGVACAKALLECGRTVHMLDAGIALEPDRTGLVGRMAQSLPSGWASSDVDALKTGVLANAKGIPLKLIYGSDFPYREANELLRISYDDAGLRPSLARGGLSNVWGAAMLPYRDADIADWPIRSKDLASHYEAAVSITGLSGRHDALEKDFPLFSRNPAALDLSEQARLLLAKLQRNERKLARTGIHFGQARVAVRASAEAHANRTDHSAGCIYCGLCMYGCPYGHIYNSADTLAELLKNPRFSYEGDVVVTRVAEDGRHVQIFGRHRVTAKPLEFRGSRTFLAAGVIATTQILLRSKELYGRPVGIKDSQYFLMPLALLRSVGHVRTEALHTLSQLFLEIIDPELSPYTVHLQVYSYNDLVGQTITGALGPIANWAGPVREALEGRLLILQGYLHSAHSPSITTTLRRTDGEDRLELVAEPNRDTRTVIMGVVRKLMRHSRQFGAWPVFPMLQVAQVGRGFHSGGSFPMRQSGDETATDTLGRPFGWQRVHAVDATVFPSIPATTILLSSMANAHRIATESAGLDSHTR